MKPLRLELATPYQVTPLLLSNGQASHRIAISANAGAARVSLEPNICQLDPFGDTAGCTRIAIRRFEATLSLLDFASARPIEGASVRGVAVMACCSSTARRGASHSSGSFAGEGVLAREGSALRRNNTLRSGPACPVPPPTATLEKSA
ncbi:hypothetical protein CYFUS_001970 [Cystobacter fuscus]|uniref:Uncharacterized protein n=1 Tax=Cystobacter fuscus TaxID=43 RepID=A0A250IXT5_9BACT|nr:hypothetical protein CYFUS_001970 [Cystobacter fuscus]